MTRQFGLQNASRRASPVGAIHGTGPATYGAQRNTGADLQESPSAFLRPDPIDEPFRDRVAKIFCITVLSLCFVVPLMLAGIMLHCR